MNSFCLWILDIKASVAYLTPPSWCTMVGMAINDLGCDWSGMAFWFAFIVTGLSRAVLLGRGYLSPSLTYSQLPPVLLVHHSHVHLAIELTVVCSPSVLTTDWLNLISSSTKWCCVNIMSFSPPAEMVYQGMPFGGRHERSWGLNEDQYLWPFFENCSCLRTKMLPLFRPQYPIKVYGVKSIKNIKSTCT